MRDESRSGDPGSDFRPGGRGAGDFDDDAPTVLREPSAVTPPPSGPRLQPVASRAGRQWWRHPPVMIGMVAAVAVAAAIALAVPRSGPMVAPRPSQRVLTAPVTLAPPLREVRLHGQIRSRDRSVVAFARFGYLAGPELVEGQRFASGQVLAALEERAWDDSLEAARAAQDEVAAELAMATRARQRARILRDSEATTEAAYEQAVARERALRATRRRLHAERERAESARDDARLRAPFDGVVTRILRRPGELVRPGEAVLELSGTAALEIAVEVPEAIVGGLAVGAPARVELPLLSRPAVTGEVVSIGAAAARGGLFPVVIALPDDAAVRPGNTAQVVLEVPGGGGFEVPTAAVVDPAGEHPRLFWLDGDRARELAVEVVALRGDRVLVRGRLREGDQVIVAGQHLLLDGDLVQTDDATIRPLEAATAR